jgi:hypothetical protein
VLSDAHGRNVAFDLQPFVLFGEFQQGILLAQLDQLRL